VTKELARLDVGLAQLAIAAPAEAEIQVGDGDWEPAATAKHYRIPPGAYVVRARREGFQPFETKGEVALGKSAAVEVALVAIPQKEKEVIVEVPVERPVVIEVPRSRVGALASGHFDIHGGAAALVGASLDITDRIEVTGQGILGSNYGAFLGASVAILKGTVRPMISAGVPMFFNDGARVALRGAAGVEIVANRHFALFIELGIEHNFNPQQSVEFAGMLRTIEATSFIPAIGATARM
jgi:hypothetical protein